MRFPLPREQVQDIKKMELFGELNLKIPSKPNQEILNEVEKLLKSDRVSAASYDCWFLLQGSERNTSMEAY